MASALPALASTPSPAYVTVASNFAGPLHVDFGADGDLYVADAFAGQVVRVNVATGARAAAATFPAAFSPGVGLRGNTIYATVSEGGGDPSAQGPTHLVRVGAGGAFEEIADLLKFELDHNPDGQPQQGYTQPDAISNPYAVLPVGDVVLVADAAGNDILRVTRGGTVSTLTALPVSKKGVCATTTNNGVPNGGCDPTPTDLKLGRDGYLYVSGLGAEVEGHIWKINPYTGAIVRQWDGFPPLTGVEIDSTGNLYAASLFTNQIFKITPAGQRLAAAVPGPSGLVWHNSHIWAGSVNLAGTGPSSVVVVANAAYKPLAMS
ncbi:MAG: hypothetical protein JWL64_2044 [Frankiales bacterium]|nr:hypothetical protein [Frankiales bacterium]